VDLGEAVRTLKADRGVELLLVEGGPSLNYSFLSRSLADEVFLTLAPKLLGGTTDETLTVIDGPQLPPGAPPASLLSVHLAGGELYLRFKLGG
jgi:2,5-diamino-6-(ribosylamino)-4(3H)-pyrimidinone 5'-phosphate reductase